MPTEPLPQPAAAADKKAQRAAIRAARRCLDEDQRSARAAALCAQVLDELELLGAQPGAPVGAYLAAPGEPDTLPVLQTLHERGFTVYVPVCQAQHLLGWVHWHPQVQLVDSAYAPVKEPAGQDAGLGIFETMPLLLVPALAIDSRGLRLGQGGGYYDRFLPRLKDLAHSPVLAAVIYDEELLDAGSFATDPHDAPVDLAFTGQRLQRFTRS